MKSLLVLKWMAYQVYDHCKIANCFQMRSLDKRRFPDEPAGQISETKMLEVEAAVRYCLGL